MPYQSFFSQDWQENPFRWSFSPTKASSKCRGVQIDKFLVGAKLLYEHVCPLPWSFTHSPRPSIRQGCNFFLSDAPLWIFLSFITHNLTHVHWVFWVTIYYKYQALQYIRVCVDCFWNIFQFTTGANLNINLTQLKLLSSLHTCPPISELTFTIT